MNIKKIRIENFKCFNGVFQLDLNEKINIIVGDNETGKSTIIEAIHLALSGWFKGRYVHNELTQYLFNASVVESYLRSIDEGNPEPPPSLCVEIYFSDDAPPIFKGNNNSDKTDTFGLSFRIEFDNKHLDEYELLIDSGSIKSLPIEYYHYYWESFARDEKVTPRLIPIKSALIDSSNSRQQNGSDVYIGRIVRDFLDSKEIVNVSQAHRKMKDIFMQEEAIKAINKKIQEDSKITSRKVELSVELSTKNAWESSLVTYIDRIPFHHIGKGEQSIIKTKLALGHKKAQEANIVLIEEPENHLSHTLLNALIRDIKTEGADKQVIICTHSSFVANKLGLESLILLSEFRTIKLSGLSKETYGYFQKLAGYDTLRLILCKKAFLVEGDSDELIVQKAYNVKHDGKLPIEDGFDVISVGTSFLRFLEISEKIKKETVVITDTDWSLESLEKKYNNYIKKNKKEEILISYDANVDEGNFKIKGKNFNYNTLEPKLLKVNSLELFNKIFNTDFTEVNEMHKYMKKRKTECALDIFETDLDVVFPDYIYSVL